MFCSSYRGVSPAPLRSISKSHWDGGEGWEEAVHMPSCVAYVTKEHLIFFKQALAYLAVGIVRGRSRRGSCGGRNGGGVPVVGLAGRGIGLNE